MALPQRDHVDRYDPAAPGKEIEMGIEFSNIGLTDNIAQTIDYYVCTEPDSVPAGTCDDRAANGVVWTPSTTVPEFGLLLPLVGALIGLS